jgi:hypothetical protein
MNLPRGRPFPAGNPGGPGRPKGSRNRTTRAQKLLEEHSEAIVRKCVIQAMKGHPTALRLCMERLMPVLRNPFVKLKLPLTKTAQQVGAASERLVQDIAAGRITPTEGEKVINVLMQRLRTIEGVELEKRIEKLEEETEAQRRER